MKTVAYIITRQNIADLLEDDILTPIMRGDHGANVSAFYFVGDGVYHLVRGSRYASSISTIVRANRIPVFACSCSVTGKMLQNVIVDEVKLGTLDDFYNATSEADHIISF